MFTESPNHERVLERVLSLEPDLAENPEALHVTALTALYEFDDVLEGHIRGRREDDADFVDARDDGEWSPDLGTIPRHGLAVFGHAL